MIPPILINEGEQPEFKDLPYFMGTKDGWYVNTPTLFGVAHVPAKSGPATLGKVETNFDMNEKRVPQWLIMKAHDFFKKIWESKHTEAMVYIIHHPVKDIFNLWVPEQYCTGASVNYRLQPGAIKSGWQAVGTIHSHCNFGAFHSGTDQHDMSGMPGLHITIGHVDRDWPEFAVALSANGQQFDVDKGIERIMDRDELKDPKGYDDAPEWWLDLVKTGSAPWKGSTVKYGKGPATRPSNPKHRHYSGYQFGSMARPDDPAMGWDSDDWDYGETYFGARPDIDKVYRKAEWEKTPKQAHEQNADDLPEGYEQVLMSDLVEDGVVDPFTLFENEVQETQRTLDIEAETMAWLGFRIQWTIDFNPKAAAEWLTKTGRESALLPEE